MKSRSEEFEEWGTEVIFDRAKGFRATVMRMILRCVSWIFRAVVLLRLQLFSSRLLRQRMLGTLVISVGNITVGGTGKTPVVELLAKTLRDRGRQVAILTRGYKSADLPKRQKWKDKDGKRVRNLPKIASDGTTRYLSPLYSGDEPFMLAKNLDDVAVLVDKNRIKSGIFAIEQLDCDTLILDDGMQYLPLNHEIDIVLVDCGAPFGTGSMLPRGTLREPKRNLKRADYIILTKSGGNPQNEIIDEIRKYNPFADIIVSNHGPKYLENVFTGERLPLSALQDKWIACLSGIARPESFEDSLRNLGAHVEICRRFPDHHWFEPHELDQFYERCADRAMEMIITTEKDAVRFEKPDYIEVPIYFLRIEVEIIQGQKEWNRCISRICHLADKPPLHEWRRNI
ncbi:MAG: tetraacyldisaccharide 4'-kinase [Akkermansia sp.]